MSTLATADLNSDDSDIDYVPETKPKPKKKRSRQTNSSDSGSSSSSGDSDNEFDGDEAKRLKLDQEAIEADQRRMKAAEAFREMKEEALGSIVSPLPLPNGGEAQVEMVKVKRARRFAGETIFETVELPSTDPEAIAYLPKNPLTSSSTAIYPKLDSITQQTEPESLNPTEPNPESSNPIPPSPPNQPQASTSTSTQAPISTTTSPSNPPKSKPKPPAGKPRKPRQTLEQMSAALTSGKKMTTLEKSQMDWKNQLSEDTSLRDELEANRRSGGYLAKQEFLDRVGERRAGAGSANGRR